MRQKVARVMEVVDETAWVLTKTNTVEEAQKLARSIPRQVATVAVVQTEAEKGDTQVPWACSTNMAGSFEVTELCLRRLDLRYFGYSVSRL